MSRIGVAVIWATLGLACAVASLADAPLEAAPGTWQKHEYRFVAMSFTSTYSCDGLADKLKLLLLTAGARKDVKSTPGGCARGFGRPDRLASAYVTFYTLAPLGPDAADKPVAGVWRAVTLRPRSPRELGIGDCEIIEQFRDQLLPMFATRNLAGNATCVPHQQSGSNFNLTFEVLAAPASKKPS